jgi:purine-nucleoside phosphorylase
MNISETISFIKQQTKLKPSLCLLLRESITESVFEIQNKSVLDFTEIPHFKNSIIPKRELKLVMGEYKKTPIAILTGRLHYYEGFSMEEITLPFRCLSAMGVKIFILTSAVGLLSSRGDIGEIMLVKDILNMFTDSPLRGLPYKNREKLHPVMNNCFPEHLRNIAIEIMKNLAIPHFEGVYLGVSGPAYETPAEAMMYERLGGDVIGMSTVPEVQAIARDGGEVLGLCIVTNKSGGGSLDDEVNLLVGNIQKQLTQAIKEIIDKIIERGLI